MYFTVYVLFSQKHRKIYVGYTSNLLMRFRSHNELSPNSWTQKYRPWQVIYVEFYESKSEALKREKILKGGKGREWIWNKIEGQYAFNGFIYL